MGTDTPSEEVKRIAQTTANLVINLWRPRYKEWKKQHDQHEPATLPSDGRRD